MSESTFKPAAPDDAESRALLGAKADRVKLAAAGATNELESVEGLDDVELRDLSVRRWPSRHQRPRHAYSAVSRKSYAVVLVASFTATAGAPHTLRGPPISLQAS